MKLNTLDLLEDFYEKIKEDYPDLDFETLKEVCFGPWRFVKEEMEKGNLSNIRLKYFGTFQVYEGRAKNMFFNNNKKFKEGKLEKERYLKLNRMLSNYILKLENAKKEKENN